MIVGIIGKVGSSKTLLMSAFAMMYKMKYHYSIYANYNLTFDFHKIDNTNFEKLIDTEKRKILVAIDELVPQTKVRNINAISLEVILSQIRHYITEEGHLLYTVQFEHQIPPDFLMHTDLLIKCHTVRMKNSTEYFATIVRIFMNDNVNTLSEHLTERPHFTFINRKPIFLKKYFGVYERYQIIKQVGKDYDSITIKYVNLTYLNSKNKLLAKIIENKDAQSMKEAGVIADMIVNKRVEAGLTRSLIDKRIDDFI